MDSQQVQEYVKRQIAGRWAESNAHGVDLRKALVTPRRTKMINRLVWDGTIRDSTVEVWLVLEEEPGGDGYTIFFDDSDGTFGLAAEGSKTDPYPVICWYCGDFWTAFRGM